MTLGCWHIVKRLWAKIHIAMVSRAVNISRRVCTEIMAEVNVECIGGCIYHRCVLVPPDFVTPFFYVPSLIVLLSSSNDRRHPSTTTDRSLPELECQSLDNLFAEAPFSILPKRPGGVEILAWSVIRMPGRNGEPTGLPR